jgi:carbamoyl-phosphate synthase large subunit
MKTILITGIGGDLAQSVATIIREERPEIRLIGIDRNLEHGGVLFVDEFVQVPSSDTSEYVEKVRDILVSRSVDVLIPLTESELNVFGPHLNGLGNSRCISAGEKVVSVGLDKFLTINTLQRMGLPVPWTFSASDRLPSEFPCIFKSRYGAGSRNVFVVENIKDAEYLSQKYSDAIFQEMLEPANQEITCAVYRNRNSDVASLLMLRRLEGGITGWAKVIEDDATSQMCAKIAQDLDLYGSMNVQLRLTDLGPRVFEINPRFSSTALMRHRVGFCDVLWSLDELEGVRIRFPKIKSDQIFVRTQDARVL